VLALLQDPARRARAGAAARELARARVAAVAPLRQVPIWEEVTAGGAGQAGAPQPAETKEP
jgi:hypothetical protein